VNRIARALIWILAAGCVLPSLATSATLTVRQVGTMDTVISALPADTIDLELVLDTMGLSFEGYINSLSFTAGNVSGISYANADLSPLVAEILAATSIVTDGVDDLNQSTLGASLPAGTYVLNTVSFTVDSIPVGGIDIAAFLRQGDTFGLGGGSVTPTFIDARVVPEPGTASLVLLGLVGLAIASRNRRI
jgi:hypothetical protein